MYLSIMIIGLALPMRTIQIVQSTRKNTHRAIKVQRVHCAHTPERKKISKLNSKNNYNIALHRRAENTAEKNGFRMADIITKLSIISFLFCFLFSLPGFCSLSSSKFPFNFFLIFSLIPTYHCIAQDAKKYAVFIPLLSCNHLHHRIIHTLA